MRCAGIDDQLRAFDLRGGRLSGDVERHDLVVVAVDHQRRHIKSLQVLAEIGGRERSDGVVGILVAGLHALCPPTVDQSLRDHGSRTVEAVERAGREVDVQL